MLKFKNSMVIHCPELEQAEWLLRETEVSEKNSKEEALSCWQKYRKNTVYCLMWKPSYDNPTIVWSTSIDDEILKDKKIIEFKDII